MLFTVYIILQSSDLHRVYTSSISKASKRPLSECAEWRAPRSFFVCKRPGNSFYGQNFSTSEDFFGLFDICCLRCVNRNETVILRAQQSISKSARCSQIIHRLSADTSSSALFFAP